MRSARKREHGTVSVYLIAVTAAFVLLTGLLIDAARVAAFRLRLELAVKSGARSVMSAYDPILRERYGLFARGGDPAIELFRHAMEGHLQSGDSGGFRFLEAAWEYGDVTESRPLADHAVFRGQILEEMKYRAPIDLTLEVAERFRGLTDVVRETKATVDVLERARLAYERRERALDHVLRQQETAGNLLVNIWKQTVPNPSAAGPDLPADRPRTVGEAARMYEDYVAKRIADEARRARLEEWRRRAVELPDDLDLDSVPGPAPEPPQHERETAAYESGVADLAATLRREAAELRAELNAAIRAAQAALEEARTHNDDILRLAAEAASAGASGGTRGTNGSMGVTSDAMGVTSSDASVSGGLVGEIRELRLTVTDLALPDSFFAAYAAEIEQQWADALQAIGDAERFAGTVSSAPGSRGIGSILRREADLLQQTYAFYRAAYEAPGGRVNGERRSILEAHRQRDGERKALEREASGLMRGAADWLRLIGGKQASPEQVEAFRQAERAAENNLVWNRLQQEQSPPAGRSDDPAQERERALSSAADWLDGLTHALEGTRDQLYYSEYVLGRFSRFDPPLARALLQGDTTVLHLERQEAEYILYGFTNPSANLATAYGEVFAFRLAVRTVEGLAESRSLGHPLVILAAALVYGVKHALEDVQTLVARGSVPLSKYAKAETHYADYLRLFLLLHGGSSDTLARTAALVERNTGVSLEQAYTYASGEGTASLKLWFFPGVMKALGRSGVLGGQVMGNRYVATYAADLAYQ